MTDARQIQLQRLVDGQLNRQHIKQMLTEAQSHNELWRDIAVAFVEDQIFEREACLSVSEAASKPAMGTSDVGAASNQSSWLTYDRLRWITAATLLLANAPGCNSIAMKALSGAGNGHFNPNFVAGTKPNRA